MKTKLAQLIAAGALVAAPAAAGVYFTATTTVESGKSIPERRITVRGWADGDRLKIEVAESDDSVLRVGRSLVTYDGGATVYLVDPEEKTFTQVDSSRLLAPGENASEAAGRPGTFEVKLVEPDVLTLADEEGGEIAGLQTRHLRFRTSYSGERRSMGLRQSFATVVEEDLWVASELDHAALAVWLRRGPESTGDAEFDALLASLRQSFSGLPLKRVAVTTETDRRGGATVVKTTTAVTEVRVEDIVAEKFNMGSGYREKPMARRSDRPGEPARADERRQEDEQYPFDRMLDPEQGQPVQHPQPGGQPVAQPGAQPGMQPGVQPGNPPAQPVEPQPPQEDPEYPFALMLDMPS